jgi:cell shape-determining protein MreD
MRWILLPPAVYLAAVAQTTFHRYVVVGAVAPDWLVIVAMMWMLWGRGRHDFLIAGAIGLFADAIAPGRPGFGAAALLCCAYGLAQLRPFGIGRGVISQVVLTGPAAVIVSLAGLAGAWLVGDAEMMPLPWLQHAGSVGLYTALASLPLWMVLGWLREPLVGKAQLDVAA